MQHFMDINGSAFTTIPLNWRTFTLSHAQTCQEILRIHCPVKYQHSFYWIEFGRSKITLTILSLYSGNMRVRITDIKK